MPTIIFNYTNSYDVYSANELSELHNKNIITQFRMLPYHVEIECTESEPVIEIMDAFEFEYVTL